MALVSLAQEKEDLHPSDELLESKPEELGPNCISIVTASEREYYCSGLNVAIGDNYVAINCKVSITDATTFIPLYPTQPITS